MSTLRGWEINGLVVTALPNAVSVVIVCGSVEKSYCCGSLA